LLPAFVASLNSAILANRRPILEKEEAFEDSKRFESRQRGNRTLFITL
jgi:hypothetical protein